MRKVFYFLPLLFSCVLSFAQPGTLDNTYHGNGKAVFAHVGNDLDQAFGMAVYPDGKVILVGISVNGGGNADIAVVRYDATGALDITFGGGDGMETIPVGTSDDLGLSVAIQPSDNKIVIAGYANFGGLNDFVVMRLNDDGTPDPLFNGTGIVTTDINGDDRANTIALQPDGKILVGGNTGTDFAVARYNTDGSLDMAGFGGGNGYATLHVGGGGLNNYGYGMVLQPDGKILLSGFTGNSGPFGPGDDIAVVRFNGDGTPDLTGFGAPNGFVITDVGTGSADQSLGTDIALHIDGSFYVTGSSNGDFATLYFNSDGTPNITFGGTGKVVTNVPGTGEAYSVYIQNDNKVLVAGGSSGSGDFTVIRYNFDGTPDLGFGGAGTGISTTNVDPTPKQDISFVAKLSFFRIYVGGATLTGVGNDQDFSLIALQNDASPLPLKLLSFTAQKQSNDIAISWKTEKEESITQFIVERSADGRNFSSIGTVTPSKVDQLVKSYTFIDKQPLQSTNFYRLTIKELDETFTRSKVIAIKFSNKKIEDLEIYPNPVVDNSVRMQLPDGLKGRINMQIIDATGRLVKSASLESMGGSSIATTLDVGNLKQGVYIIKVQGTQASNNNVITLTRRFVKN